MDICDWKRAGSVCNKPATTTWTRTGHRNLYDELMDPECLSRCDKHPMGEQYGWVPVPLREAGQNSLTDGKLVP